MRDAHDTRTADVEGLEPLPPPAERMAQKRARMGYMGPKERPACANCTHVDMYVLHPDAVNEVERLRCTLGGFTTQRGALCGLHRRK